MADDLDPLLNQLPALRRYALALSRDESDAEDLVQEALLRGHEHRRSLRPGGNLRAWLFGILRHAFLDRNRAQLSRRRREAQAAALTPRAMDAPQDAAVRLSQLRAAFLDLPPDQREALALVAVEGLTYAEAAALAQVPMGTLMSRVARARKALRDFEDGRATTPSLKLVGGRDADDA
ncbi:sigma-70 family RNA polymerase sigma factor [Paracoccus limosus]|jgi:RNA polymerase sigma-70 factor (ECF subfamily)|uniref:Sigma-70 family RNA polymerase sigma factor n=1 Tax=Paracoccus limosus TaxID=913252 RepID=A0A844H809_9RHOB|nr:sigma-70 family RNA polymerase sigma factor [Paracoccus limosus]MTH34498.1 sigma-70 family RNA polymerase sigma factor [Paracoccus limosus]